MANTSSARKCVRQQAKRRLHNASLRSRMRTAIKKVIRAVENKDRETATKDYRTACSLLDSSVNKHLIHKNKAARHKRQLNSRIHKLSV